MNRTLNFLFVLSAAALTINCSSSSDGGGSSASSFNAAYVALKSALPGSESTSSLSVASLSSARANHAHFAGNHWAEVGGGTMNQVGDVYISSLVDEDVSYSVLGRVRGALMIACLLDLYGTKDSTGKLAVGNNLTIKMKRTWANAACPNANLDIPYVFSVATNIDSSDEIPLVLEVTDISADGVYDRKIDMLGSFNPQFGGADQIMRLKISSGVVTFSHEEFTGSTSRSTSYVKFQPSPELIQFQHSSANTNIKQLYRFYVSGASNRAALLASEKLVTGTTEILTLLAADADDLDFVTMSQSYVDIGSNNDGTDGNGCINFGTGVITPTQVAFGSCNGVTGILASTAQTTVNAFNALTPNDLTLTDTFVKTFDETNISTLSAH